MDVTEEVVCDGVDQALDDLCAYSLEGVGEDIVVDAIAAIACGTAGEVACKTVFETSWNDKACAGMFGDNGCCGDAPTQNTCGVCPADCVQLSNVFPHVYNDDLTGAMTACQSYYSTDDCNEMITAASNFLWNWKPSPEQGNYAMMQGGLDAMAASIHSGSTNYCSSC